jgi:hypothetical protein
MNLAIRAIDGRIAQGDAFANNRFHEMRGVALLP